MTILTGTVQDGKSDANVWLRRFAGVYAEWLGRDIFPGSLNVATSASFDWSSPHLLPARRRFSLFPHGGERDLFMIPCTIVGLKEQPCWLWTTTTAAENRPDPTVVEIISSVGLRATLTLKTGSTIAIEYPGDWAACSSTHIFQNARSEKMVSTSFSPSSANRADDADWNELRLLLQQCQ